MKDSFFEIHMDYFAPGLRADFFGEGQDTVVSYDEDGLRFTASRDSRDPYVPFRVVRMMDFVLGADAPADARALGALVLKVRTEHPACCEVYFTCGDIRVPTPRASAGGTVYGTGDWEYVVCDLSAKELWRGPLTDGFRLDWSGYVRAGDSMVLSSVLLFADAAEARAYAEEMNKARRPYPAADEPEPETAEVLTHRAYYVCLREKRLISAPHNILTSCGTLRDAVRVCDSVRMLGYRVCDEAGNILYTPYSLLECDVLREARYVTEYARTHGFRYGDAPINPGIDNRAGLVSCDRLVCWALYRLGFVYQPFTQGVVVSAFPAWCRRMGFEQLTDIRSLRPGDIMLVRANPHGYPEHTFLFAGYTDKPDAEPGYPIRAADPEAPWDPSVRELYAYRYDCGSDERIRAVQPTAERLFSGANLPFELFRPAATPENCVNWKRYQ